MRSRTSCFNSQYPLLSLRSSSNFLRLLPRLPVTSIPLFIFPSITHCRRQFLRKMWPIQFAFRFLISCRIFLCSLTLSNTSSFLTRSVQLIFSILLHHCNTNLYVSTTVFITQGVGYMFRLINSHLQAYLYRLSQDAVHTFRSQCVYISEIFKPYHLPTRVKLAKYVTNWLKYI